MNLLTEVAVNTWYFLVEAAPYLILGFAAAGALHGVVGEDFVARHLGRGRFRPVLKAALLGMPLPLCSCGVLPAAMGLRKKGATKGATLSFLISTPETGVDSIAVTYALLDPIMTVLRPVAALVTAVFAGVLEVFFGRDNEAAAEPEAACSCCGTSCAPETGGKGGGAAARLAEGFRFTVDELLKDLAPWLAIGIVAAGLISTLVPDGWIESNLGTGLGPMLMMLLVGVPMYICATASTPVAAALILKGLGPGAALVLLLVGPATNVASLVTISRTLGFGTMVRYLAAICVASIALGLGADYLYQLLGLTAEASVALGAEGEGGLVGTVSAMVLVGLTLYSLRPRKGHGCGCSSGGCAG